MNGQSRRIICNFYLSMGMLFAGLSSGNAVTINITYDAIGSTPHTLDPAGAQLTTIVDAAADVWENIILDPWTLNITIRWTDLSDAQSLLGLHQNTGTIIGKPTTATIGFDTLINGADRNWYFDATPTNHSEYNLQQTVFSANGTGFSGATPNVMEVGYQGTFFASAPPAAQSGSDLLSVALHEIGHALGLTTNVALGEVTDGDYDVNPNFVGGANMSILDDGSFHLVAPLTQMFPSLNSGTRILPSAADVFAVAASPNPDNVEWAMINLERRNFLGGADLNDDPGWIGGLAPDGSTDAWVRQNNVSPPFATATANLDTRNLTVQDGSVVNTAGFRIRSTMNTTLTGTDTQIRIGTGGELEANNVIVNNGARLRLLDNSAALQTNVDLQGKLDIDNMSVVEGYGNVLFNGNVENDGKIRATDGNLLWFITAGGNYDLDGEFNFGRVEAKEGDLKFSGTTADDFKGLMNVGPSRTLSFTFPWVLHGVGAIVLAGSAESGSGPAVLAGDEAHIFGYVYGVSLAEIQAPTIFESTSQISVDLADAQLTLKGDSTFRGANIIGDGTLKQLADITVEADTAIDTAVYDWGNSLPGMVYDTTVNPDVDFTVNSPETGQDSNEYRGTIHLNNGALYVQTSSGWTLPSDGGSGDDTPGTLILHNNNEDRTVPQVRGADLTLGGLLVATGGLGIIGPALITQPTGEINVQTAASLSLEGEVTYDGPLVHGAGTLIQNANANVISSTTIATNIFDWDGDSGGPSDLTISPGAVLTINSSQIDANAPATDGYDGHVTVADSGALIVNTSGPWRLDGTMTLQGQQVTTPNVIVDGPDLMNYGTITGNGRIQASLENHGTLSPGLSAGALKFETGFLLTVDSIVDIELGGLTEITQFDQININQFGTANLGGALEVSLIDSFLPQPGDVFKILTAGVVSGKFDTETGINLPAGLFFDVLYHPQSVNLKFSAFFSADFDLDGDVDGNDFLGWQRNPGVGSLTDWQTQYGSTLPLAANATAVPEPGGLLLLAISFLCVSQHIQPPMRLSI